MKVCLLGRRLEMTERSKKEKMYRDGEREREKRNREEQKFVEILLCRWGSVDNRKSGGASLHVT